MNDELNTIALQRDIASLIAQIKRTATKAQALMVANPSSYQTEWHINDLVEEANALANLLHPSESNASLEETCSITEELRKYRKDFENIMKGWKWSGVEEVLNKLKEELLELIHARDVYASSLSPKDKEHLLAELADVIIVSAFLINESEMTLSDVINARLRSNIDRANRAANSANIKGTEPKDEWGTTKRSFEL